MKTVKTFLGTDVVIAHAYNSGICTIAFISDKPLHMWRQIDVSFSKLRGSNEDVAASQKWYQSELDSAVKSMIREIGRPDFESIEREQINNNQ